jgi:hypothetical protein
MRGNWFARLWAVGGNRCCSIGHGCRSFVQYAHPTSPDLFNLNATFAGQQAIGDVAFDGTNLYVSSWHSGSGVQTVRLVRGG